MPASQALDIPLTSLILRPYHHDLLPLILPVEEALVDVHLVPHIHLRSADQ